jgi:hypothetical protein
MKRELRVQTLVAPAHGKSKLKLELSTLFLYRILLLFVLVSLFEPPSFSRRGHEAEAASRCFGFSRCAPAFVNIQLRPGHSFCITI